ncbi:MAG: transketolase [Candidatus Thiodiazotropha sp. (ex Lucina aurantia)]|uniref:Transketolase n=2 Tax=Candidatus Thiodiazotropha TaxID=1913444 RepID=A0A7Z1AGJ4_9GAMM|nr:transketolase [Candidatus Thiodiazotropha endolucinida]MBT3012728.1 transketolase [Candidatus Thiodiazotropha sp. (ex Lucina pensylvanica)]MBT3014817.1 transketolase [Candidatus Thiodiazotropha taylori]MBT3039634.1 transketolase [Candidatus Thiodiazotropha sp. (ex Codakia orbicularis)]MBV2103706.1 transketolase [Candidatus Thiodiazotropha sp. (ex Lucina aurantia)]MBT3024171.1 transketolase [Candidatus Thiodiazotropha taylori]
MSSRRELANAIRALSMDAVQKANSGHPGAPMGMADIAEVLWNNHMKHNPANPEWADRDRFVLSNGHGSMLIYSLLHLTGYELSIDDLKSFRQLHSKTPGHPEYGYAPGVETTTGPLGQGITNAIGMALAEKTLAAQFNKPGHEIVDHNTYAFLGDGCMMEGISHEACSLAGTLGLGKLIAFWDDNGISIDGETEGWFTDDTPGRFEAYGWHVIRDVDGHDAAAVDQAIEAAKSMSDKPSLICCKTTIGFGSPNLAGSHDCHGAPLGDDEIAATREQLGWSHEPFVVPDEIYAGWDAKDAGTSAENAWNDKFAAYAEANPELAAEFKRRMAGDLPANWDEEAAKFIAEVNAKAESPATRKASQNALNGYGPLLPEFMGGSADLTPSNLTAWSGSSSITDGNADGNYLSYGVREFGMSAIMNGVALHGGFIPYGGTFLMFSEYARNALRMAALMKLRSIFVYTHDSIGLGEDGPTHQPIEQIPTLRMIPNMDVWRPCDGVETAVAWKAAVEKNDGPSSLIFSRQGLAHQERSDEQIANIAKGGYVVRDCEGTPDAIVIATGSEVGIAIQAAADSGKNVRVVSMPNTKVFDEQDAAYKESVLPLNVTARVAVEAAVTDGWYKYVGLNGKVIGINRFGESAPAGELFKAFGFTAEKVAAAINEVSA